MHDQNTWQKLGSFLFCYLCHNSMLWQNFDPQIVPLNLILRLQLMYLCTFDKVEIGWCAKLQYWCRTLEWKMSFHVALPSSEPVFRHPQTLQKLLTNFHKLSETTISFFWMSGVHISLTNSRPLFPELSRGLDWMALDWNLDGILMGLWWALMGFDGLHCFWWEKDSSEAVLCKQVDFPQNFSFSIFFHHSHSLLPDLILSIFHPLYSGDILWYIHNFMALLIDILPRECIHKYVPFPGTVLVILALQADVMHRTSNWKISWEENAILIISEHFCEYSLTAVADHHHLQWSRRRDKVQRWISNLIFLSYQLHLVQQVGERFLHLNFFCSTRPGRGRGWVRSFPWRWRGGWSAPAWGSLTTGSQGAQMCRLFSLPPHILFQKVLWYAPLKYGYGPLEYSSIRSIEVL